MDKKTILTYDLKAEDFGHRHAQLTPSRLYDLAKNYFLESGLTLDIGCGIGRDTNWLANQGFNALGIDPSKGMLRIAKDKYPGSKFLEGGLPEIISDMKFDNIFCCAVLMHIPRASLATSISSLNNLLNSKGCLILSFRSSKGEEDGRLFENYQSSEVTALLIKQGGKVLLNETDGIWTNIVIEGRCNE